MMTMGSVIPMFADGLTDDEVMLDVIGRTKTPTAVMVLMAWRSDVESEPFGELVDIGTAMAAIQSGARRDSNE